MRHYIFCIFLLTAIGTQAQQVNPVPDYVFRNQMSVGRNAVTDTSAYMSIGPRYGANKGLMPPIVSDTAAITGVKRNGLLIFSVQRNNFQYWDSINSRWTSVTANVDTTIISTRAWRKKGDDSLGAVIATKVNISDTATMLNPYTRGSGTVNYVPKFTTTRGFGNSQIFDNGTNVGIGTTSPSEVLHVVGRGRFTTIDSTSSPINVLTSDVNGVIRKTSLAATGVQGSGTTNYVAKFTASGTVGNSILQDDGTRLFTAASTTVGNLFLGTSTYTTVGGYKYIVLSNTTGAVVSFAINGTEQAAISLNGSTSFNLGPSANIPIGFFTNSNERMRVTGDGELLINTTTDVGDFRLQVNGNANFRDDVLIDTNLRVNRHISLDQTPKAWALGNAIEGPQGSTLFVAGGGVQTLANIYYDGSYKYSTSNPGAAMFLLQSGITFATYGSGTANGALTGANEMVYAGGELRVGLADQGTFKLQVADKSYFGDEVQIASTTDLGNYKLQVTGEAIITAGIRTDAPSGGTAATWKLGTVATVSPTSPNRTIEVEIGGTTYYIHAKTTND